MKKQPHITEQTKNNLRIAFWSLYAQKPIEKSPSRRLPSLPVTTAAPFISTIMMYMIFFIRLRKKSSGKITDVLNDSLEKK